MMIPGPLGSDKTQQEDPSATPEEAPGTNSTISTNESADVFNPVPPLEPTEVAKHSARPVRAVLKALCWVFLLIMVQGIAVAPVFFLDLSPQLELPVSTTSFLLIALLIVRLRCGAEWCRVLALRGLNWSQVACVVLLVPVTLIVASSLGLGLNVAYKAVGVDDPLAGPSMINDFTGPAGKMPLLLAVVYGIFFVGVLPAIGEEVYFRGFIGRGLVACLGVLGGTLATSILFGLLHFHAIQVVVTAFIGILYHAVFLWSRSLFASILFHATYNSLLFVLMAFVPQESVPASLDATAPPWALLLAAIMSMAAVCWLYYNIRVRWILPDGSVWKPGHFATEMPPTDLSARPEARRAGVSAVVVTAAAYTVFLGVLAWELL
jgi:membrane protease YdiL (CAAX protease family)